MVRRIPIQFGAAASDQLVEPTPGGLLEETEKKNDFNALSLVREVEQEIEAEPSAPSEPGSSEPVIDPNSATFAQELQKKLDRALAQVEQMAQDLRNYKRHAETQLARAHLEAKEELLAELGDSVLSLEQAAQMVDQDPEAVRQGVALVARGIQMIYDRNGLERIATVGHTFDPTVHEAVLIEPARQGVEQGNIVREISPGFRSAQRVVRPAKVSVAG